MATKTELNVAQGYNDYPAAPENPICKCGHPVHLGKCSDDSCGCMSLRPTYVSQEYRDKLAEQGIEIEGFPAAAESEAGRTLDRTVMDMGRDRVLALEARVAELEQENTDLKRTVNRLAGGSAQGMLAHSKTLAEKGMAE